MSNNKPLRRGVDGVCTRSACECERQGLGDQCVWLKPAEAEFECLGEPSLCANPRGCACFQAGRTAAEARWYCLDRDGVAMLCKDEADALDASAGPPVLVPGQRFSFHDLRAYFVTEHKRQRHSLPDLHPDAGTTARVYERSKIARRQAL